MIISVISSIVVLSFMISITCITHYIINPYFVDIASTFNSTTDMSIIIYLVSWLVSFIPALILFVFIMAFVQKIR